MKTVLVKILSRISARIIRKRKYPSNIELEELFSKIDKKKIIARIKEEKTINVAFFMMAVPLWKYESLFKAMQEDSRFNPIIFVSPRNDSYEIRKKDIEGIIDYCRSKGFKYVDLKCRLLNKGQEIDNYNIDLAFYTQPYENCTCREYYYDRLKNALLCYIPYGYIDSYTQFCYNSILHKICWKHYLYNNVNLQVGDKILPHYNNRIAVGVSYYDTYLNCKEKLWKQTGRKRIIWAPHSSIQKMGWVHLSCFLDVYDDMVALAKKYQDRIQIAFKPHPHLYPALCTEWGKERTDSYYRQWMSMPNTMLCDGDSYPLFKSSDALIHDCGSFVMEYHYTQNPCLYITLSGKVQLDLDEQGIAAYNAHYHAFKKEDIEKFVVDVILNGNDTMSDQRRVILEKYILPKNGKSATQNIIDDLEVSLGLC